MNLGFLMCGILFFPFLLIGLFFAVFKEKAARFVSGFNSLSKDEQERYDKAYISRDIRNQCFVWSGIMFVGNRLQFVKQKAA